MNQPKIIDKEGNEVGIELVVEQIELISKSMKKIEAGRASRKLIVALLHDDTKIGKYYIESILDSLEGLEKRYLKPKKNSNP